jgi:hypothetical protein
MNNKIHGWLTLDILLFIIINAIILFLLGERIYVLSYISIFEFIILGLATYRCANIISNEPIAKPLRAPFVDEKEKDGKIVEEPKRKGFQRAFGLLIYCPSCTGVWIAAIFVYSYIIFPIQTLLFAFIFALSGVERIFSRILGWFKP